jgi:uncharacterized damage-inducible protein DinB
MVNELAERLERGRDNFLRALEGVSEEQARRKPADGGWSILECVEHVAIAEWGMLRMTQKAADGDQPADRERDAQVLRFGADRSRKAKSPEAALPTGRYASLAEAAAKFRENREKTLAWVREITETDLRRKSVPHPLAGALDGYQMLLLMSAHPERHLGQIAELKT